MNLNLYNALVALVNEDIKHIDPVINGKQLSIFIVHKTLGDKSACRKYIRIRTNGAVSRYNPTGLQTKDVPVFRNSDEYYLEVIMAIKKLIA